MLNDQLFHTTVCIIIIRVNILSLLVKSNAFDVLINLLNWFESRLCAFFITDESRRVRAKYSH